MDEPDIRSGTPAAGALAETERRPVPDMEPVLRAISQVVARIERLDAVRGDDEARLLLRRMTQAPDMERFEPLADALARRITALHEGTTPAHDRPRPVRRLLKL
ncbi:hypothetical protein [uncultured Aureimonas sp.]|uniref:hypothetical protein n=1 Tax=uncultured Aureimonas sp. TaxID=1604662 RepID=UPI0025F6B690|nr:hypothetical protein [uncultured Aureimonas sp.]